MTPFPNSYNPRVRRIGVEPNGLKPVAASPYTEFKSMEMQLNPQEASLVEAFRRLPPDTAAELSALAERLAALAPERKNRLFRFLVG
jgi:hypothetical protein